MRNQAKKQRIVRLSAVVTVVLILAAACQSAPPTQYLLEVTREVTRVVVVTEAAGGGAVVEATATLEPAQAANGPTPQATEMLIPTPVSNQIIVSEQAFERGRMFWLEPTSEIWVIIDNPETPDQGEWSIYDDTWNEDTELAFDPSITPPSTELFQPERGFGKLWRDNQDIRDALGWAVDPEGGHATTYTYVFRGDVVDAEFLPEPGYHTLISRTGDTFLFDEATGIWQRIAGDA